MLYCVSRQTDHGHESSCHVSTCAERLGAITCDKDAVNIGRNGLERKKRTEVGFK